PPTFSRGRARVPPPPPRGPGRSQRAPPPTRPTRPGPPRAAGPPPPGPPPPAAPAPPAPRSLALRVSSPVSPSGPRASLRLVRWHDLLRFRLLMSSRLRRAGRLPSDRGRQSERRYLPGSGALPRTGETRGLSPSKALQRLRRGVASIPCTRSPL